MNEHWGTRLITWVRVSQLRLRVKGLGLLFIYHDTSNIPSATVKMSASKQKQKHIKEKAKKTDKLHFGIPWEVGIYRLICIWSLESLCGDSAKSFHLFAFFPNTYLLWSNLCPSSQESEENGVYPIVPPPLTAWLIRSEGGMNHLLKKVQLYISFLFP